MSENKPLSLPPQEQEYFHDHLGMVITFRELGHIKAEMPVQPWMKNPIGSVHGGAQFTFADTACGAACITYGHAVTTIDATMDYLAPALKSTMLYADATVLKHGRTISVTECIISDDTGKLLAKMRMSFYNLTAGMAASGKQAPLPVFRARIMGNEVAPMDVTVGMDDKK